MLRGSSLFPHSKLNTQSTATYSQTPQPTQSTNKITDETDNWNEYTSPAYNPFWSEEMLKTIKPGDGYSTAENIKHIKISIKHPKDWTVKGSSFKSPKGDLTISIATGFAPGGNLCSLAPEYNAGVEIKSEFASLKRVKSFEGEKDQTSFIRFTLCSNEHGTGKDYASNTSIGKISYLVSNSYIQEDLAIMDKIVSTLKKTRLDY